MKLMALTALMVVALVLGSTVAIPAVSASEQLKVRAKPVRTQVTETSQKAVIEDVPQTRELALSKMGKTRHYGIMWTNTGVLGFMTYGNGKMLIETYSFQNLQLTPTGNQFLGSYQGSQVWGFYGGTGPESFLAGEFNRAAGEWTLSELFEGVRSGNFILF